MRPENMDKILLEPNLSSDDVNFVVFINLYRYNILHLLRLIR